MSGQTRIASRDMADALERMAHGKQFWLSDFGRGRRKRPDHEIEQKRQELTVLQQAAHDYRTQEQFQEKCAAAFRPELRKNKERRP